LTSQYLVTEQRDRNNEEKLKKLRTNTKIEERIKETRQREKEEIRTNDRDKKEHNTNKD
jgi:hypothetical protein